MQICQHCKSRQFDGTIFCSECGASMLLENRDETTTSFGQPDTNDVPIVHTIVPVPTIDNGMLQPPFSLIVMNSGRCLQLTVEEDLLIGRKDEARGILPDIDLGRDGGYDAGVSRRHAILSYKDNGYYVEDLNSANGTFINGRQLAPQMPIMLSNGDELRCATLLMRVEIKNS
ncbi:MAG: FHA domain-containing protein [Chloroflexi bacterium AL-W]|nr:FHA domain-containing protein [Chloroflexi bacterium AL-N1]NOK70893.1 FHA domain-containing protein [Chloroflexi bacterium AL-N10]NOK78562.1 FHA domain-containing protein [Chloroflexi bacterium AL-N5]NOK85794.1 FHA domain-containing protein [Chloroflexi bacterium AL-W]NOK92710.1 FHA domain-containing protein [Chloroflexi bacterium AL-N15]